MASDTSNLIRQLRKRGLSVTLGKGRAGHWQVRDGQGRLLYVMAASPSCPYAVRNNRAALRRMGVL